MEDREGLEEILKDVIGDYVMIATDTGSRYYGKILRLETAKNGDRKLVLKEPRSVNALGEHLDPKIGGDRAFRLAQIQSFIFQDPIGVDFENLD